ncbi:CehA/McbA family metallohydrolase [Paenibacillus sp. P26]|nr:CehA/McbA family metallohydrolase [Paenibacillus sp. P26]
MRWIACELHTHTFHSDGKQTLEELAQGAAALGFECIALTDHNTMTGLKDRHEVEEKTGIRIIPGMEWTTFFGHMVTIGLQDYVDWRPVGLKDIHRGIAEVHAKGGIAGMAHPFRMGTPVCTGRYWEYEISDWNDIDYIEVWSGTFPSIKKDNARAFALWTDRLNAGYRITATSGRDWHVQSSTGEPISVTYLGIEEGDGQSLVRQAVKALSQGRAMLTIGPLVTMEIHKEGTVYRMGDEVPLAGSEEGREPCEAAVLVDFTVRKGQWELPEQDFALRVTGNTGLLGELTIQSSNEFCRIPIPCTNVLWARAELWGTVQGVRTMIACTNAVYFGVRDE